jgi:hypothetical protein
MLGYGDTITITLAELNDEVTYLLEVGARAWRETWARGDELV